MRYLSVCSGIEAATVAWHPLGWVPVAFSEIEKFPSAVLAHHWPDVPNLGDFTAINGSEWRNIDVLVGGTPCQAFSVAGMRRSLRDARGNLTLKFVELANAIKPSFLVWENVPGILNTKDNAFGCLLGGLAGENEALVPSGKRWTNAGYVLGPKRAVAWRVLDAQYFGVAQRRRRVFVVGCPRNGADPGEILFESEGLRRDTPPSRKKGSAVTALTANGVGTCGADDNQGQAGHIIPQPYRVANCLTRRMHKGFNSTLDEGQTPVLAFTQNDAPSDITNNTAPTLRSGSGGCVCFEQRSHDGVPRVHKTVCPTLNTMGGGQREPCVMQYGLQVRRLTPIECERLQGFPDNHTRIPWRGKAPEDCPVGPRYKALGNSMAVPVMRWIGERIQHFSR